MWPPLFGASLLPFPLLLTHLCSVSLRQSPALQHHAGKLLVFRAPCPQHHPLYPVYPLSCCVSGSLPPHPGGSRMFTAVPCLPLCSAVSGGFPSGFGDPRDLSSPAPGLCSSLIWCSHNRAAALSGPVLSVQCTVPRGQEPLPQLQSLALLPSWSLAQSKPRAGCACSGRGASHREHPMGASPAGEPEPGENFLSFFPPHSNAQDGRITTVR